MVFIFSLKIATSSPSFVTFVFAPKFCSRAGPLVEVAQGLADGRSQMSTVAWGRSSEERAGDNSERRIRLVEDRRFSGICQESLEVRPAGRGEARRGGAGRPIPHREPRTRISHKT